MTIPLPQPTLLHPRTVTSSYCLLSNFSKSYFGVGLRMFLENCSALCFTLGIYTGRPGNWIITGRNDIVAKVMFLHVSVILFTGGGSVIHPPPDKAGRPPQTREPPPDQGEPSPPDQGQPPQARETPRTRDNPPRPGRETPLRPGRTPRTRENPPLEADFSIRSTSGRYASYWNTFLLVLCVW